MRLNTAAVVVLIVLGPAHASQWPILLDPKIDRCSNLGGGTCNDSVLYSNAGVIVVPVNSVGRPDSQSRQVRPMGVHCSTGNAMTGDLPFAGCSWQNNNTHAPRPIGKCELVSIDSWELTSDSSCTVQPVWGGHSGAGPGGECVVFTNSRAGQTVSTPWGILTAEQAANSGNRFCSKPLPPSVTCELQLPAVIDHGQLRAGETSKRADSGTVNCGGAPKIDVLVNGDRDVGGVRISATPHVVNPTTVQIASEITVSSSAVPGEHSATYVFVASPY